MFGIGGWLAYELGVMLRTVETTLNDFVNDLINMKDLLNVSFIISSQLEAMSNSFPTPNIMFIYISSLYMNIYFRSFVNMYK